MKFARYFFIFVLLTGGRASVATSATLPPAAADFVPHRCVDCHDADAKKGGLDLTALSFELKNPDVSDRWVQVFDRVAAGEMPPKTEERPDATALRSFLGELRGALHTADAARIASDGRVRARRLIRA